MNIKLLKILSIIFLAGCSQIDSTDTNVYSTLDTTKADFKDSITKDDSTDAMLVEPLNDSITYFTGEDIVEFAKTLKGVPYLYGSTDPSIGLDCSGFITTVFNHFNYKVPRSSVEFTDYGTAIPLSSSKMGDLILFTGTDSTIRIVGHMGIITENQDSIKFIHSTSGKAYSVTETPLNKYYQGRFVKVVRPNY